jgi:hypothetical protein
MNDTSKATRLLRDLHERTEASPGANDVIVVAENDAEAVIAELEDALGARLDRPKAKDISGARDVKDKILDDTRVGAIALVVACDSDEGKRAMAAIEAVGENAALNRLALIRAVTAQSALGTVPDKRFDAEYVVGDSAGLQQAFEQAVEKRLAEEAPQKAKALTTFYNYARDFAHFWRRTLGTIQVNGSGDEADDLRDILEDLMGGTTVLGNRIDAFERAQGTTLEGRHENAGGSAYAHFVNNGIAPLHTNLEFAKSAWEYWKDVISERDFRLMIAANEQIRELQSLNGHTSRAFRLGGSWLEANTQPEAIRADRDLNNIIARAGTRFAIVGGGANSALLFSSLRRAKTPDDGRCQGSVSKVDNVENVADPEGVDVWIVCQDLDVADGPAQASVAAIRANNPEANIITMTRASSPDKLVEGVLTVEAFNIGQINRAIEVCQFEAPEQA